MAKKPKDPISGARGGDDWGIGQTSDGSIDSFPPEELATRLAQRNADEQAFAGLLDDDPGEGDEG